MMTDNQFNTTSEESVLQQLNTTATTTDVSFQYDEYGELEQSLVPAFEFSSPISSISSNCSSPDRTAIPENHYRSCNIDDSFEDDDDDFVSLEELKSQISPPSDDECSAAKTLTRHSHLETIFEDVYLETPPGTPTGNSDMLKSRKRRITTRMDLSKCEEFKENVQNISDDL
jgi:hypothetical protein